ncbi:P-loop ATPase, Sll1717 family [Phenylobacterium sp.]|uniref:P-loop ATPase, Sll1717 family n=1 Tax=Phenylobacterium sp. TaxID=1871053 RepID=UPI003BAA260E
MKRCSELKFGFIDAQRYLQDPDDPLSEFFRRSFYKSTHLAKAVDPDIYFLLGEKGTGKTAYAVYASLFMKDEYNADCEFFDKNDFTRFIEVASNLSIEKSQYSTLWVFIFLILFVQRLDMRFTCPANGHARNLIDAVREINLAGYARTISQCIETAAEIDAVFASFVEQSGLKVPKHMISSAKPAFKMTRLIDLCIESLGALDSTSQFTVFVDGLDVRPDEVAYPDYLNVVSSICNSVWVLNATQLARIPPSFKISLLLRPDIFEAVPFQNRGPKLQNHAHLVEWSAFYRTYQESEIFKFTDLVLLSQQDDKTDLHPGDTWSRYFPFKIESRVSEIGDDPFILFLRHSFYKPRDIIKYLSLMRDLYNQPSHSDAREFGSDVFDDREIRREFSSYLLQEIRDQLSFYYTNDEYQQFLDFANGFLGPHVDKRTRVVTYDAFESAHAEYLAYNKKNSIKTVPSFATADITLQFMFDLNVLGYYEERTLRSGDKRVFTNYSFRQRSFANLRPKVPTGRRYVMHYGVAKSLFVELGP